MTHHPGVLDLEVLLVRHAMPTAVAHVPAPQWQLSAAGRTAAQALRGRIPPGATLVASDEPKARQTLHEATGGAPVPHDAGFGEVRRPPEWVPDHRARAHAYVQGGRHPGWEQQAAVVARFDTAVARHAIPGRVLVVGTHGMAATLWVAAHTAIDPGPFWSALRFPDLIAVDLTAGTATVLG